MAKQNEGLKENLKSLPLERQPYSLGWKVNKGFYICQTCLKLINQDRVPPTSAANNVGFDNVPPKPELTGLSNLEARMISARLPFMWIRTKQGSNMKSIKGTLTCVPADVSTTVQSLPRNVNGF